MSLPDDWREYHESLIALMSKVRDRDTPGAAYLTGILEAMMTHIESHSFAEARKAYLTHMDTLTHYADAECVEFPMPPA